MSQENTLTQAAFDSLLNWLDAEDREEAGKKYEAIRRRLITIFTCRGRRDAEELADETITRVTLKAQEVAKEYVGDPALYFYGVAQKIYLEALRKRQAVAPPPPADSENVEKEHECLERCMEELSPDSRELVLDYYRDEKRARIERRRKLAEKMGIAQNALRIRAHRIRASLQQCVERCLERTLIV
jgi:DNA-directed RNA polymerase specialized sigma24 family protein